MKNNKIIIPWIVSLLFAVNVKAQWTDISVPTNQTLTHGAFTDDLRGYVSSYNTNKVWRTLDGGMSWDSTTFAETVLDIDFSDPLNGCALLQGGADYKIKTTTDGGTTWNYLNFLGGPFDGYNEIITTNPNTYIISSYNFLQMTNDNGANWDTIYLAGYPYANDKEKINDDTLFFTGWDGTFFYQGAITKTYTGGTTWDFLTTNQGYTGFNGTHFTSGMNGYGVYQSGWGPDTASLSMTNDGGMSWNVIHFDTSVIYSDVYMKNQSQGYLAYTEGTQGKIQSTNDGINWSDELTTSLGFQRFYHGQNTLYVVGMNGQVFKKNVPLGISDNKISNLEIFPNPANEFIQLKNESMMNLTMTDINGKIVLTKTVQKNERIDLGNFANGMYFLRMENEESLQQGKIIISK